MRFPDFFVHKYFREEAAMIFCKVGVLELRGPCEATYDVELFKFE